MKDCFRKLIEIIKTLTTSRFFEYKEKPWKSRGAYTYIFYL